MKWELARNHGSRFSTLTMRTLNLLSLSFIASLSQFWIISGVPATKPKGKVSEDVDDFETFSIKYQPITPHRLANMPVPKPTLNPVSEDEFEDGLQNASTYYDLIRIFYGTQLSKETIDSMLFQSSSSILDNQLTPQAINRALQHVKEIAETKKAECKVPKAKVISVRELSTAPNRRYYPHCTVLHQCLKEAGCCNSTSECGVKTTQNIYRSFIVTEILGGNLKPTRNLIQTFVLENHTECQCNPVKMLPTCNICPFPFTLRRKGPNAECSCDCFEGERTCLAIKRGRKPLKKNEISCVKTGACHVPECKHGEFKNSSFETGYCPSKNGDTPRKRTRKRKRTKRSKRRRYYGYL